MCQLCDRPDLTMDAYLDAVRDRLTRDRFLVQAVSGSMTRAELSYTVGLTASGLPELVVLGVRAEEAQRLLTSWGEYVLDGSVVLPGEALTCGPWVMEAVAVARPTDHLRVAAALYGDAVRGLQLAWCDSAGRWPWQPGHRARRAGQPLLGERAPAYCDEHRPDRLDVPPHP
jgi:hypothetical protein